MNKYSLLSRNAQLLSSISPTIIYDDKQRTYIRVEDRNGFHREAFIENPLGLTKQKKSLENQDKSEYFLQNSIKSQFIVLNMDREYDKRGEVWIQQDFDFFLNEVSLSNLDFQSRMRIFYCVAYGLFDLHSSLICHSFLSPTTISIKILADKSTFAKINFFQYAAKLNTKNSQVSQSAKQNKSNMFSSPELKRKCPYSLKTDIYSLGCLLNYLLYETLDNIKVDKDKEKVQVDIPSGNPKWFSQLLESMLNFNPKQRKSINEIVQILKVSQKCIQVLERCLPIGKQKLKKI